MDSWINPAATVQAAAVSNSKDLLRNTSKSKSCVSVGINSMNNSSVTANQQHTAPRLLPKLPATSMFPPSSFVNYGALHEGSPPSQMISSIEQDLRMLNEALLLKSMVSGHRGPTNSSALEYLRSPHVKVSRPAPPKLDLVPVPTLLMQTERSSDRERLHRISTPMEKEPNSEALAQKRLKTGFSSYLSMGLMRNMDNSADKSLLTTAPVFVSTQSEILSSFPLPASTTMEQNTKNSSKNSRKRKPEHFMQAMQAKWDRLECESDAMEHETDAEQEAIVKECFLRWLHRYSADHLRQRFLAKKLLQATMIQNSSNGASHN